MATYQVNRGVGKSVEFFGLRAQYVLYLVLLISLITFFSFISSMIFDALWALLTGIISFLLTIWACFKMNNKYGEYGLMQLMASKNLVKHISVTKRVYQIVEDRDEKN